MKLFDENGKYTTEGVELVERFEKALRPIFLDWRKKGYFYREIFHIAAHAVVMVECELILTGVKKYREKG